MAGIDADKRIYLLDLWRGQTDSWAWIDDGCRLVKQWRPLEWAEEGGQINASLGPFIQRRAMETQSFTYRWQFPWRHDKAVRAQSIRGRMAMSGVYLPADAPWRADFKRMLACVAKMCAGAAARRSSVGRRGCGSTLPNT